MLQTTLISAKRVGFPSLTILTPPSNSPLGCPGLKGLSRITVSSSTIASVSPAVALAILVSLFAEQLAMLRHAIDRLTSNFDLFVILTLVESCFRHFGVGPVTALCVEI